MKTVDYKYSNCPIPGGGFVTGFEFNKSKENSMYIRTDIGGTYRYDYKNSCFLSLIDHVDMTDLSETYPIAITTSGKDKNALYIACGVGHEGRNGVFAVSKDNGETFTYKPLPVPAHGNWNGRGTGKRLIIDDSNGELFFASPRNGLLVSNDEGDTWTELDVCGEKNFTFVFLVPGTDTLIVSTAGITTRTDDTHRGHSLFISYDRGLHFEKVSEPDVKDMPSSRMSGLVGHRYAYDGKYLYVTMNHTGARAYVVDHGYSCDCGQVIGGVVLRYSFDADGKISDYELISPEKEYLSLMNGYGGIDASSNIPGLLVLSTITRDAGDVVYRSYDYGNTWEKVLEGLSVGKITFEAPYMRPCCNGGGSLIHWLTDIKFNPYNDNEVWFNTGTGVFGCENFLDNPPVFHDKCAGIEETVHLNLYAPPAGEVKLIDILGDLGGFAFTDVDKPCDNSFADSEGNRYITCLNADYSDIHPETVIVTPRGNWTGRTKGGLIISHDQCKTFERINLPYGLSNKLDDHFKAIECPNVNSGWVAISPDTKNIVWSVADIITLYKDLVIFSNDGGVTWGITDVSKVQDECLKVYSDRMDSDTFFGFTEKGHIYVSHDKGASFTKLETNGALDGVNFGLVDCANKTEIRGESGKTGVFYIAAKEKGLWKMVYKNGDLTLTKLSCDKDVIYRLGLGILREGGDYMNESKALYVCAKIQGDYGFFRSFDEGKTWEKINDSKHMFGDINSLEADKRKFGRFYIATGSRGVIYGEPV